MRRLVISLVGAVLLSAFASTQGPRVFYPSPAPRAVTTTRDVPYGAVDGTPLAMDVYRPATGASLPALVFFNTAAGAQRAGPFYSDWATIAAGAGIVGIVPDLRGGSQARDFDVLMRHLTAQAAAYGINPDAIAVYAGSGNVSTAFPVVEDPKMTSVKAAVMYYGVAPVTEFRLDLPVLYVRAGLDRPPLNRDITEIASRAITQNAPLTLLNHPTGHHAFEMVDDDAATRAVITETLDFIKRATSASYQAGLRGGVPEARAAGLVLSGQHRQAAALYADLVAARPDDTRVRLAYGEALLGDAQFAPACAEFEKLKGKGLGPRDLGLPAAKACLAKGDADAAIAWLQSIPQRYLPLAVQTDPAFAALKDRPDFRALFPPRV